MKWGICLVLASAFFGGYLAAQDIGQWELENAFKGARPVWPMRGVENLPTIWAEDLNPQVPNYAVEKRRLQNLRYGSDAFKAEMQLRYGLYYEPTFENDGLPVGMTRTQALFSTDLRSSDGSSGEPGLVANCRACHAGTFFGTRPGGKVYVDGLSNVFFDIEQFNKDVLAAAKLHAGNLFKRNPSRNTMVNAADYFGRLLTFVRRPFPSFDKIAGYEVYYSRFRLPRYRQLEADQQAYLKTQNWVNVGTKLQATGNKGLYVDGGFFDNPSSIMYGMAFTLDPTGADFLAADQGFLERGVPYISSLKAPKFPHLARVDARAADRGFQIFQDTCQRCHGTYQRRGPNQFELVRYPGVIVPAEKVGTDPFRAQDPRFGNAVDGGSWIREGRIKITGGYTAPPLNGVWARSPYLHNGSVPTIRQLMNPSLRMTRYAIQPRPNDPANYDERNMGWKAIDVGSRQAALELRARDPYVRIYDPDEYPVGLSNTGHRFGAKLSDPQIDDLIAFLKNI